MRYIAGRTEKNIEPVPAAPIAGVFKMKNFLDKDFLLETPTAQRLYHDYAAALPIIDYHCHLPPDQIADNMNFQNLTQIWLNGDHYKWRDAGKWDR